MEKRLISIFGLSAALLLSANVSAHEKDRHLHFDRDVQFDRVGYFDDVDANGDGKVSRDEYLAYNSDSRHYDKEWRENHWDEMIAKFDFDDDNQITTDEIEEYVEDRVAEVTDRLKDMKWLGDMDWDFDFDHHDFYGDFDSEEFSERLAERMEDLHERIEKSLSHLEDLEIRGLDDGRVFAFRTGPHFDLKREFIFKDDDLDSNADGVVSKEEFLKEPDKLFERLDKNGDGVLDKDEMDKLHYLGDFAFTWHDNDEDDDGDEE